MTLSILYQALSWVSSLSFLALGLWCCPAMMRLIVGRQRYYDPLKTVFLILSLSRVGYGGRRIIKGLDSYTSAETLLLVGLMLLSITGAVFAVLAIRSYEKTRDGSG